MTPRRCVAISIIGLEAMQFRSLTHCLVLINSLVTLGRTPQPASKEITPEGIVAQDYKSQLPSQVAGVSLASRRIVGKQGARRQAHPSRRRNVGVAGTITISGEWLGGAPSLDGAKRAHKTWRHLNKT